MAIFLPVLAALILQAPVLDAVVVSTQSFLFGHLVLNASFLSSTQVSSHSLSFLLIDANSIAGLMSLCTSAFMLKDRIVYIYMLILCIKHLKFLI